MSKPALPQAETALEWLRTMLLIRRFEESAGEMYTQSKIGGFLHLCIGEEATVVGSVRAMEERDYLFSTYREHGQAIARGTDPKAVMAELFGRVDGCCGGRGGSMHLFDSKRRFMGGYGIVGGNLPLAAGAALMSSYRELDEVTVCMLGDGATNQGTFGETLNLAALWNLPIVFIVTNNQFGMGTALSRHSAVTDLKRKGEGFGVPGMSCDGMDICSVHDVVSQAITKARTERKPVLVEAVTYRFRGHSMADPQQYRTKDEVTQWRERDPLITFPAQLIEAGILANEEQLETLDQAAQKIVEEAVLFADQSPRPAPESLYDNIYNLGGEVKGWYSIDSRSGTAYPGESLRGGYA